jgi:hypothetical protein
VTAHRQRAATRIEAAMQGRAFPHRWRLNMQAHPQGRLVFHGVATGKERCRCWAEPSPWTRSGSIAWSEPRWTSKRDTSASTPCADGRQSNSRRSTKRPRCYRIDRSVSDFQVVALVIESCFKRPLSDCTYPVIVVNLSLFSLVSSLFVPTVTVAGSACGLQSHASASQIATFKE